MPRFGYTLYCEGNDPNSLIEQAQLAEAAGFDFLVISDHIHPWLGNQKHSAFAWSVLGAIAQVTTKIGLATMVTCPIMRYHPVIVAQMAATMAVISGERFTLGLGSGERLNEHVVGRGWPSVAVRHTMLSEAIDIISELWDGDYVQYKGGYYQVDDARIFDLPKKRINMFVAAGGKNAAYIAAIAGGICVTEPKKEIIDQYRDYNGPSNNTWGQVVTSWDKTEKAGLQTAYDQFRFSVGGWKVQAELPNPANFDAATSLVKPQDLAGSIPAGPDVQKHHDAIEKYLDAGVQNLALVYPGKDFAGFMKFWQTELNPALA